jgi:hypothetical protein
MNNIDHKSHLQRRIKRKGPIFLKGYFSSNKNKKPLFFESYLELAALLHFEYDPNITFIDSQPHSITYTFGRKKLLYTPDILVMTVDKTKKYVEVKPSKKLKQDRNSAKFSTIEAVYQKLGREFDTFSELDIPKVRLKNLELLFHGASACHQTKSAIDTALCVIRSATTVREAHERLIDKNLNGNMLHYLLFMQYLTIELDVHITDNSPIELNVYGQGLH